MITDDILNEIKNDAIKEFELLSRVYRPSFQTRKIADYLKQRVKELNPSIEVYEDEYRANLIDDDNDPLLSSGNVWYDLPANDRSMVNNEPIILQAHIDMVCTAEDEQSMEEMKKNGVELEYHANGTITSKDNRTSLGADNGIGMAVALAITKSNTFKHGPIRCLFTTDEEVGMAGASYVGLTKLGDKGSTVKGFKYLLNNDNAFDGEILTSTAGAVHGIFFHPTEVDTKPLDSATPIYTLHVSGLLGGHSGDWIALHASAIRIAGEILNNVCNTDDFRIIEFTSPESTNHNIIHTTAICTFASKMSLNEIQSFVDAVEQATHTKYPDEKGLKITIKKASIDPNKIEIRPFSHEVSLKIITLVNKTICGPTSWKDKSIQWIETSGNIGPINVLCKKENIKGKEVWHNPTFMMEFCDRSCNNDHIKQLTISNKALAKEVLGCDDLDYYQLKTLFYGWPGNNNKEFVAVAQRAYEERGVKWTTRNLHGGLEVSWFKYFNPELNILSIGAEIHNMHSSQETLYTGTLDGVIAVTLECIAKMKTIHLGMK